MKKQNTQFDSWNVFINSYFLIFYYFLFYYYFILIFIVVFICTSINCNKCINNYFYKRINVNDLFIIECSFCIIIP